MGQSRTAQPLAAEGLEWVRTCQLDAGQLTSDGGLDWVQQADAELGLCAALAAQIPEWRTGPRRHSLETLVRQQAEGFHLHLASSHPAEPPWHLLVARFQPRE